MSDNIQHLSQAADNKSEQSEAITLHYPLYDPDEELPVEEDDLIELTGTALVVRVDDTHFRNMEPFSISPFGPVGGLLDFGVVFEAKPLGDGAYRYLFTVEEPPVWTFSIDVLSLQTLDHDDVRPILEQISQSGGHWEWMQHILTIQGYLTEGDKNPPTNIEQLIAELIRILRKIDGTGRFLNLGIAIIDAIRRLLDRLTRYR